MKGKITVVFLSLVLVFGMLAASCDNEAYPSKADNDPSTYLAYASDSTTDLPKLAEKADLAKIDGLFKGDGSPDDSKIKADDPRLKLPFLLDSGEVYAKLNLADNGKKPTEDGYEAYREKDTTASTATNTVYVQKVVLGKVAVKTTWNATTDSDKIELATKYAGLPILVANPKL